MHSDKSIYQNAYSKKTKKITFEIGGAGKRRKQLKGISGSRFVLTQPGNLEKGIPLILFGFLW